MKVAIEDLGKRLKSCESSTLPKIILLNGSEPLLIEEALDECRQQLKEKGFSERIKYQVETGFNWSTLTGAGQAMSLFAEQRILELRVPKSLGTAGTKAVTEYCNNLPDNDVLIIIMPLLDKRQRSAKWFKTLEAIAWVIDAYEIPAQQFLRWIKQRFQSRALRVESGVAELLSDQTEGNLLAAAQEIDKLQVLAPDGSVTLNLIERSLADQARFDVYALTDAALLGDFNRVSRIKARLQSEGVEPVILVWSLVKEVRIVAAIAAALSMGHQRSQLYKEYRVWKKREPIIGAALNRLTPQVASEILEQAARLDQTVKGQRYQEVGDIWYQIEQLCARLCSVPVCSLAN
ncbi:MAG: DNA polymerase III subunit delta [Gammaproteobacteria bacterium]|nr:DNA polymerase III subunit delta [Gammaproteobacteria bacterium]